MSPHEKLQPQKQKQQQRRSVVLDIQPSRTVTPELSDVSSASEQPPQSLSTVNNNTTTTAQPSSSSSSILLLQATPSMCLYCFDVLIHELIDHRKYPTVAAQRTPVVPPELETWMNGSSDGSGGGAATTKHHVVVPECPLFITWDKQKASSSSSTSNNTSSIPFELRGCIGTLQPKPMTPATFQEYALTAGLRDRRFPKLSWSELSQLRVAVSLLIQFEECAAFDDWTVGVHGIIIRFAQQPHASQQQQSQQSEYSATYLPEVAYEQKWDQMAAIQSLIRKAGYRGTIDAALLKRLSCTRYQSSKLRMTYTDYVQATAFDPVALVVAAAANASDHHHHHHHHLATTLHAPGWNTCTNL